MTKAPFLSTNNVPFKYLKYVKLIDFEIAISLNWIPDDWPSWNLNLNRSINWFKRDSMRYLKEPCIELRLQYSVRRTYTKHTPAFSADYNLSPRFKNSGKYGSGLNCHWIGPCLRLELSDSSGILFSTELSSKNRFKILFGGFSRLALAHSGFDENKTQHWALFSTKTNLGRFYFIGPNSLGRAEDLAASCQSRDKSCQSWVKDRVLKLGFRNYGSSRSF